MVRTWCWCLVLVLAGCAPGNPGMLIGGALAPSDTCTLETGGLRLTHGVLDVAPGRVSYTLNAAVFSQLINLGGTGTGVPMADPNAITVISAEVELRDVQDNPIALGAASNPYTVPANGFIPSSDGSEPGSAIVSSEIIPPIIGEGLRGAAGSQIVAVVRFRGRTAGGSDVLSGEFFWPIELCSQCLFGCVEDEEGVRLCRPACSPGQDRLTVSPAVCEGILASCIAEM